MELTEAKSKFINSWGTLGSQWGINRTMSQVHALLMLSAKPLSTEDIMQQLNISRGNANMNLRALMDWGLVSKEYKQGDRKEYFLAGKDIWEIARKITAERRKRELEPVLNLLTQLKKEKISGEDPEEVKVFNQMVDGLSDFTGKANDIADKFIRSDSNWFYKTLVKLLR
jgi:DNA-binding transcriptional regulator GbsR (MarR family)